MCDMWCVYVKLNRQRMGDCLDNLNIDDLHLLEQEMEQSVKVIRERKVYIINYDYLSCSFFLLRSQVDIDLIFFTCLCLIPIITEFIHEFKGMSFQITCMCPAVT